MKFKTTCPESQRENLNKYLVMRYNYMIRAEKDDYPAYKLKKEYEELCDIFCYLNDHGVRLICLEFVDMFTCVPRPIPKTKTAWQVFTEFLQENDFVIEFTPDPSTSDRVRRNETENHPTAEPKTR